METNVYGLVQSRLYFKPVWLKIGIVLHIIVEVSKIEFRKKVCETIFDVRWKIPTCKMSFAVCKYT